MIFKVIIDKFDEEKVSLSKYCIILIVYMSKYCEFKFIDNMLNYYNNNNISSNSFAIKFSALNVFRAIIETKEKVGIFPSIVKSLPMLTSIILENILLPIRKLLVLIMRQIPKNFEFLIIENYDLFDKFMSHFLNLLNDSQPHIIYTTLESINKLVKQVNTNDFLVTNLTTKYSQNFYKAFLSLAKNTNLFDRNNNIPKLALYTLGTYGTHVSLDAINIIYNVIKSLIEMFANTLIINNFNNQK